MKNSYKLLGVFWDNREIPESADQIRFANPASPSQEMMKLSEIMTLEEPPVPQEPDAITVLLVDYVPATRALVVFDFYLRRLLQIVEYYHAEIACSDVDMMHYLNNAFNDFYKRKHRADCWRNQSVSLR